MEDDDSRALRLKLLGQLAQELGLADDAVEEIAGYGRSPFQQLQVEAPVFPLQAEAHLAAWSRYAAEAGEQPLELLRTRLPQLCIPVREGVSQLDAYAEVVRRGGEFREDAFGGRLQLRQPEQLKLSIHEHPAGALPVLATPQREDFEDLYRAIACRSEPVPVNPSVNAQIVAGFVNWDRVEAYRAEWSAGRDPLSAAMGWPQEMGRVAAHERWRLHDRLVITCVRPYSSVSAADLGLPLSETEWLDRSTGLRVEHEFTHYATKRVYGSMSLNLLDEALADWMGTTYALGEFRAEWFLRFLGLEDWPAVRESGRVHTYASELSPDGFRLACAVAVRAAAGLERIAAERYDPGLRGRLLLALAPLALELHAAPEAEALFAASWERAGRLAP